jgi:hypothetical protein
MEDRVRLMKCRPSVAIKFGISFLPTTVFLVGGAYVATLNTNALIVVDPFVAIFAVFDAVAIYLFLNYLRHDFAAELRIDYQKKTLTRSSAKSIARIDFASVTSIVINKAPDVKGWMNLLEDYHYTELVLKNQETLIITFLLCDDLRLGLDNITRTVVRKVPYII